MVGIEVPGEGRQRPVRHSDGDRRRVSNESGIENSRMFITAPPAFVGPGRNGPGRIATPSRSRRLDRRKVRGAKLRLRGAGTMRPRSGVDDDHEPIPDSAQGLSAVDSSMWPSKDLRTFGGHLQRSKRAGEFFGDFAARKDPALQPFPADHCKRAVSTAAVPAAGGSGVRPCCYRG